MKLIAILSILLVNTAFSRSYHCEYNDSQQGEIEIDIRGKRAHVRLINNRIYQYDNCATIRDDFGLLIDCKSGLLDFMVLLNSANRATQGGIMSNTHDLFTDIHC